MMRLTTVVLGAALVVAPLATPRCATAQSITLWLDANGAHSRPPSGAGLDPANYGLLGSRLRVDGGRSAFELGATHGRGIESERGSWLSGRAAFDAARVRGAADFGIRAEGSGLTYLTPVQLSAEDDYSQRALIGSVRPFGGLSVGAWRIGAEAVYTRGIWQSELGTAVEAGTPGLPLLPGRRPVERTIASDDGEISVAGGAASVLRVFGPATIEVRGSDLSARNEAADGRYRGVDATLLLALGGVDVTIAGRHWTTPTGDAETGGLAGLGIAVGESAYLHAAVGRSVSDPVHGARGATGFSAGVSMRLGRRALGPPAPVAIGAPAGAGRTVVFTLKHATARSVAVAGDFNGWQPRALQRGANGVWTLETVVEPGVHHYSFVIDGEEWMVPESASGVVDDGFGRKNATLIVNSTDRVSP